MPALTSHTAPVIDEENPLYCPSISAVAFLESVRKKVYSNKRLHSSARTPDLSRTTDELFFPSFHNMLDKSLTEEDLLRLHYFPANAAMFPTRTRHDSSSSSLEADSLRSIPSWKNKAGTYNTSSKPSKRHVPSKRSRPSHVHTSDSFSEFRGPFRREKSAMTVNDGSFELSARAERLHYFPVKASFSPYEPMPQRNRELPEDQLTEKVRNLEDELYGPQIGTETPRGLDALISRLANVLPGVRLKEKLRALDANTHQRIVDILSMDGNLNARVLNLLRMSEIECLDLAASMTDEEGLNLDARDLLHVFSKPNSFIFLNEINMNGTRLNDSDLQRIHHLPRLARLWISNTGIGNEAIFHLVSLKRSLTELDIAFNPDIDDDAIPALIVLHKLRFLTLLDTHVAMPGLRRFCAAVNQRAHTIELEVARQCEIYIEKLGSKYILQPEAPMISDPQVVSELSTTALKRNLAAHAQYNAEILAEGSKHEMAERLRTLLEVRQADLLVRDVLWKENGGYDEEDTEVF